MSTVHSAESHGPVIQFPSRPELAREQLQREKNIEARLHELADSLKELYEDPYLNLLNEKGYAREALEELMVKETTLGWIVRIAKRSENRARFRLWVHIEHALADLEKLVNSLKELRPENVISALPDPCPR